MITRTTLGSPGLTVSAMGLGCMGMSESHGAADWDGGLATVSGRGCPRLRSFSAPAVPMFPEALGILAKANAPA